LAQTREKVKFWVQTTLDLSIEKLAALFRLRATLR
jgi:hypothetical protein